MHTLYGLYAVKVDVQVRYGNKQHRTQRDRTEFGGLVKT
jgi:hypothetical protein